MAVFTLMAVAGLAGCGKKEESAPQATAPQAQVAKTTPPTQPEGPIFGEAIATLEGSANMPIHAQISGYLIKQAYQEGAAVKPGDLLFVIDPKPFHADLYAAQVSAGSTRITSPIAGVAGRAIPGLGDWIKPGMTLTTMATVDPIEAEFTLPYIAYQNSADRIAKVLKLPMEERPESFELILADGTAYPLKGRLSQAGRETLTPPDAVTVRVLFPNPDRALRPGQYVKVRDVTP
jgi:membrane fusion protein (multidrug efflux system)